MAHLADRKFFVNGKPVLCLSGEVHYFRLRVAEWEDRLKKAKAANCNAVASYIPWLFHEEVEGDIDLTGRKMPEHDLGAFIDLCQKHGLWFIARPGPFTMGEVKNEGLPYWIYTKCPEAVPVTWGGKKVTSKTLNYLDPKFLKYVRRWYDAVMPVLTPRQDTKGGNVIALQLDNEVGMLQCWTEQPDFSEQAQCEFAAFVQARYSPSAVRERYPFDLADPTARAKHMWDGAFPTALEYHADLTEFYRDRFARYMAALRGFAEEGGLRDVPYIVNLHGSGGGRATTFPIGISQMFRAYSQAPGYWPSSDHYLGDLHRGNVGDMYMLNAFMAATARPEQPLSSVEFEAGSGDYGENRAVRYSGAATDFKARLSVVQGNRMLNHYLLAGGRNPMLEHPLGDGNDRLGTTGERHGFAAPIDPEGNLDANYHSLADTNRVLASVSDVLCGMSEELDGIALGFLPDYYSTDIKVPAPMREKAGKLESVRGALEGMVRNLLAQGLSFTGVNLQEEIPAGTKAIALACAELLPGDVQARLLRFVAEGGHLLIHSRIPTRDLEMKPATQLADGLGLKPEAPRNAEKTFLSVVGSGFAATEPEVRIWEFQPFSFASGEPFLKVLQTDRAAGVVVRHGAGKIVVLTAETAAHFDLWRGIVSELGAVPAVEHDDPTRGVVLGRLRDAEGQRFVSLVNLDQDEKLLELTENGRSLFGRKVHLPGRKAKLLPVGVRLGSLFVRSSTTEVLEIRDGAVAFRRTGVPEYVDCGGVVATDATVTTSKEGSIVEIPPGCGQVWIRSGGG